MEPDIIEQLQRDFGADASESALQRLQALELSARLARCIVFAARGHPWHFEYLCNLAKIDYRDVIMAAEYARSGERLYDFSRAIHEAMIPHPYAPQSDSTHGSGG